MTVSCSVVKNVVWPAVKEVLSSRKVQLFIAYLVTTLVLRILAAQGVIGDYEWQIIGVITYGIVAVGAIYCARLKPEELPSWARSKEFSAMFRLLSIIVALYCGSLALVKGLVVANVVTPATLSGFQWSVLTLGLLVAIIGGYFACKSNAL